MKFKIFIVLIALALVASSFAIPDEKVEEKGMIRVRRDANARSCDLRLLRTAYGFMFVDKCIEKCVALHYKAGYCNIADGFCKCTGEEGNSLLSRVRRSSPICDMIVNRTVNGGIAIQDNCDTKCSTLGMNYKSGFCKPDGFCKCTQIVNQEQSQPAQPEQPQPAEPAPAE